MGKGEERREGRKEKMGGKKGREEPSKEGRKEEIKVVVHK